MPYPKKLNRSNIYLIELIDRIVHHDYDAGSLILPVSDKQQEYRRRQIYTALNNMRNEGCPIDLNFTIRLKKNAGLEITRRKL